MNQILLLLEPRTLAFRVQWDLFDLSSTPSETIGYVTIHQDKGKRTDGSETSDQSRVRWLSTTC